MQLAITGATGHIGGQVARLLSDQGLPLILPLRNPSRAPRLPCGICKFGGFRRI